MATPLTDGDKFLLLGAVGDPATRDRIAALLDLAGTGDVTGPGSSTDNALVRFDGTTGALIQNSGVTLDDSNNMSGIAQFSQTNSRLGDGTAGSPALSFTSDTNTGVYRIGADDLGISTGGTLRMDVSTTAVTSTLPNRGANGSAGAPQYSFAADTDSGMYLPSGNQVVIATNGADKLTISSADIVAQVAMYFQDGSAATPGINFINDTNTGIYRVGADDIGLSTGGSLRLDVSTTAVTSTLPLLNPDGAAATPSYSFSGDTNTGLYRIGADNLGVSTGGTLRLNVNTAAISKTLPILAESGTSAAPSYAFTADVDTGVYLTGVGELGLAAAGSEILRATAASVVAFQPLYASDGAAATPSLTFNADTNTGLYRIGADSLGVATNGVLRLTVNTTAVTSTLQVRAASVGVGNSAAATTPGTVTKKIEVFDTSGVSLGFLPVYDAIT